MFVIQIGGEDGITDSHRGVDEVYELVVNNKWYAVILEPNPRHFEDLKRNYKKEDRVTLIPMAVSEEDKKVKFFDCEMPGASTLIEDVLSKNNYHNGRSKNYKMIMVQGININTLLQQYNRPDYLVIDAEGFDGTIIEMLDFKKFKIPKIRFEFSHIKMEQLGRVCLKLIKLDYTLTHDRADIVATL